MNELFYNASRLTKLYLTQEEEDTIKKYFSAFIGNQNIQDQFFAYCKQWKISSWVDTQIKRKNLSEYFTSETLKNFGDLHQKIRIENESRNAEAIKFLKEFRNRNIDVAILKGNLLAINTYEDTGYKKMNDFDILVHLKDWDEIQDIYFSLGYIPLGFGWSGEKQKPAKFSHTGMSFISSNFKCIIGTQWGLKSPTTSYRADMKEAWQTSVDFNYCGIDVKQLSPEYNLLHLILHMGIYKCGIRDCMDVYNILLSENIDEDRLVDLCKRSNAADKAYFTFCMTNFCSDSVSKSLLSGLKPVKTGYLFTRTVERLRIAGESGDIQVSYNDYFQDIEKNVIYFNLFHKFHQKISYFLKIIHQIFWPEMDLALRMADKNFKPGIKEKIYSRLKSPFLVFALLAGEIGWTFTFLLFIKIFIDLLLSTANYILKKESYFDYLIKKNINPVEIEKVVKNIQ
jgi:hypothetical protein